MPIIVTPWWWLSFCDTSRPAGEQFIGVALVRGRTMPDAIKAAHALGCNPGGEVMGADVPAEFGPPPAGYAERLLSLEECKTMQALWTPDEPEVMTIAEHEERERS